MKANDNNLERTLTSWVEQFLESFLFDVTPWHEEVGLLRKRVEKYMPWLHAYMTLDYWENPARIVLQANDSGADRALPQRIDESSRAEDIGDLDLNVAPGYFNDFFSGLLQKNTWALTHFASIKFRQPKRIVSMAMHLYGKSSEARMKEIFTHSNDEYNRADYIWFLFYGVGLILAHAMKEAIDVGKYDVNLQVAARVLIQWKQQGASAPVPPAGIQRIDLQKTLFPFVDFSQDPAYQFAYLLAELFGESTWPNSERSLANTAFAFKQAQNQHLTLTFVLPAYFIIPLITLRDSRGTFMAERDNPGMLKTMRTYSFPMSRIASHAFNRYKTLAETGIDRQLLGARHDITYIIHEHREFEARSSRGNTPHTMFQPLLPATTPNSSPTEASALSGAPGSAA